MNEETNVVFLLQCALMESARILCCFLDLTWRPSASAARLKKSSTELKDSLQRRRDLEIGFSFQKKKKIEQVSALRAAQRFWRTHLSKSRKMSLVTRYRRIYSTNFIFHLIDFTFKTIVFVFLLVSPAISCCRQQNI